MRFLHVYAQEKNGISGLARKNFMKAEWSYGEKKKQKTTTHVKEGTHLLKLMLKGGEGEKYWDFGIS